MIHIYRFCPIDSRMYICIEGEKALIVDPCISEDALKLLREHHVSEALVLLTHEHYDHISGVNWLRDSLERVTVLCSKKCADALPSPTKNLSAFSEILFADKAEEMNCCSYSCTADEMFEGERCFTWEGHDLLLRETPGHSKGSICILMDETKLFSGDSLVTGYETITRLPGGSKKLFREDTLPYLKSLSRDTMVYPGHGDTQALGDFFAGV